MRFALVLLAVGVILPAQTRSRKAHEHGSAKVNIAFETAKGAPKGVVEFESPAEPLSGLEIRFGFTKVFPKIHDVDVALLVGEQQSSADVENDKGVLKIAK